MVFKAPMPLSNLGLNQVSYFSISDRSSVVGAGTPQDEKHKTPQERFEQHNFTSQMK
jgi:hypothetical protein